MDASVIVAILGHEDDWESEADRLDADPMRIWSAISRWESIVALRPRLKRDTRATDVIVDDFASANDLVFVPIGATEASIAVEAHARYGKGSGHPAKLNMGDCFAYACARTNDATLLYKGGDFAHTDLA